MIRGVCVWSHLLLHFFKPPIWSAAKVCWQADFFFLVHNLQKDLLKISMNWTWGWCSERGCQLVSVESSSALCCVQSCDTEKIRSVVNFWHGIIAYRLASINAMSCNTTVQTELHRGCFTPLSPAGFSNRTTVVPRGSREYWGSIAAFSLFPFGCLALEEFVFTWVIPVYNPGKQCKTTSNGVIKANRHLCSEGRDI